MHTLTIEFNRYKFNRVHCSCGVDKWFSIGIDARHFAYKHEREHILNRDKVAIVTFNNGEEVTEGNSAHPGRNPGSLNSVLY